MPITRQPYAVLSDNLLELVDLTDSRDGSLISNATVTCVVTDDVTGFQVAGGAWPLAMPAVAGVPGRYRCTLPLELTMALHGHYTATISASAGYGLRRQFLVHMAVKDDL